MPKLQKTKGGGFFLRLPKELVLSKKWSKGQRLVIVFNERGNMEVREA